MRRFPPTFGEDETVVAPDYLVLMSEAGRALPYGITGLGIDFGTLASPTTIISLDGGTLASPSRLPLDFG
jgi:hypothetical protein